MNQLCCNSCGAHFTLLTEDYQLYTEKGVEAPNQCSDCRHQRRTLFRNEQFLYRRPCSRCTKEFVSIYAADKPYTVYCPDCFWSDNWDPLSFGKPFDYNRPFFEQVKELTSRVPLLGNTVFNSTNCEFNGFCVDAKDCYMCTRVAAENCMYSYLVVLSESCVDCFNAYQCQFCYECVDCWGCYGAKFSQLCRDSSDISFCYDLIGCRNCFGCVGLRNAEYYFFNKKCTKAEYEELVKQYDTSSYTTLEHLKNHVLTTLAAMPRRALYHMNSQNAEGDYITESKDVLDSFDVEKSDTVRHSWGVEYAKDVVDGDFMYFAERCFNSISNSKSTNCDFCFAMLGGIYDSQYSMLLYNNSHDCFGCISLKKGSYSILNVAYEKDAYFAEREKIIEHLKKTGEFGSFFPPELSLFGYNETAAAVYFPLTKHQATAKGFNWYDGMQKSYQQSSCVIPDTIDAAPESFTGETLSCESCNRNYKIVAKELAFYRTHRLPIPHLCHLCRHNKRVALRNPRKLFTRDCDHCKKSIQTSYPPDSTARVYCESCYSHNIYN